MTYLAIKNQTRRLNMNKLFQYFTILLIFTSLIFAQEKAEKQPIKNSPNGVEAPQVVEGDVIFTDGPNQLLRITDEGSFGAIQFQDGVPSDTDFKLYRNGLDLYFGTSNLSSGGSGVSAIDHLTDAKYDTESLFIGDGAGASDDAGVSDGIKNFNLAVGKNALSTNTTGRTNVAFGNSALLENIDGSWNTAIGSSSMRYFTSGMNNVALGFQSNYYNQTGSNNTVIGHKAGYGSTGMSYSGNVFIGFKAGFNETESDKLYIENSDISTPLIWGDFENDSVKVNGRTHITNSLSVGSGSKAVMTNSLAVGNNTEAHGLTSIAVGEENLAWGFHSSAFGLGIRAMSYVTTAVGRYNVGDALDSQSDWNEADVLFEIGNGADNNNRSNAVTVLKNGNVGVGPSAPTASFHVDAVNGVLFDGSTSGGIPVEGSGSRMMWYQGKSAFRAGSVQTQWDDASIGDYSAALNFRTTASGTYSFATGYQTEASGQRSTAMGSSTIASGLHSTALGSNTEAVADFSTAIGRYVKVGAAATGTIFIGDNSVSSLNTASTPNRFSARFDGGYRFFTKSDLSTGALMNNGDNSWSTVSDSTKKENFFKVDGEEVLNKISKFNLRSWNYKTQDPAKFRHYGPMAQEFFNAFGNDGIGTVGNDTTIASADFDGINLIAIQALEKRSKEQEVRIKELEKQNQELVNLNSEYKTDIEQIKNALNQVIANKNEIRMTAQ